MNFQIEEELFDDDVNVSPSEQTCQVSSDELVDFDLGDISLEKIMASDLAFEKTINKNVANGKKENVKYDPLVPFGTEQLQFNFLF